MSVFDEVDDWQDSLRDHSMFRMCACLSVCVSLFDEVDEYATRGDWQDSL